MTATDNKHGATLLEYYISKHKDVYDRAPDINRFKEKWNFIEMYKDLGVKRAKEVIDYFFELPRPHTLLRLFKDYGEMSRIMYARAEDAEKRARLLKETEERVKNWSPRVERN